MTDSFYKPWLDAWQVNIMGKAPTQKLLDTAQALGLRPGKQALAVAMGLRPEGVTRLQIIAACGAPQMNRMTGLEKSGYLKRDMNRPPTNDGRNHYVYAYTVTPKGQAFIDNLAKVAADKAAPKPAKPKAAKPAAKPVKVKGAAKPKAAKPKAVPKVEPSKPVEPAPAATEPAAPQPTVN